MTKESRIDELQLAHRQLQRMRGMTRYYHQRFFADVRATTLLVLGLLVVGFWEVPEAFLLVPVVALIGANQTAFDASYLFFARHYARGLEDYINSAMRRTMLVASDLEDTFLFPLGTRKIVTIGFGNAFTWFGWMTALYTTLGVLAFAGGIALGWTVLTDAGVAWVVAYLGAIAGLTVLSVVVGRWWFVSGTAERRLGAVIDERLGATPVRG